mgnify:CR=1 FL=1
MINAEQKVSKFEGALEQMNIRLDGVERRLDHFETRFDQVMASKADKWEIRIWFIVLMTLIAILQFVG